jgi:hypothetical protein
MYPYKHCPHCGGELPSVGGDLAPAPAQPSKITQRSKYNQDAMWKAIVAKGELATRKPPSVLSLVGEAIRVAAPRLKSLSDADSLVHLLFDKPITPQGGLLYTALMGNGNAPPKEILKARGYVLDQDGHVAMDEEAPVGLGFQALQYWGGEKQHRRWHLAEPITINSSRHGDPFFMDSEMVCFGAKWADGEKFEEALSSLLGVFLDGVGNDGRPIATPLVLEIVWR